MRDIVRCHLEGTRFGIHVDPKDGLLVQGAEGYQLTWMDAKCDGWVVTPRRGKAVEINALWYNALRLLQGWTRAAGDEASARELEQTGLALRVSWQFHWRNEGYRSVADFLSRFNSKRRHMLRREMAAPAEQGITIRTIRGEELARDPARWARAAHALHRSTVDKLMWGRRWLNEKFYLAAFAAMTDAVEVVAAFRAGELIAGAFNVASPTRLYGRYWGCFEEHPFLHFNVCYYHSIADCIGRGLEVFEGGAGGEHKLARGFLPALTYSAHGFVDERLDRAVRDHLARETPARAASIERSLRESPIFKAAS
jgi:predicted N-acyltransferase